MYAREAARPQLALLDTIETEHLVKGDSVNLSPLFLARQYLAAEAESFYFARGKGKLSQRGMSPMTLRLLGRYGAQPYDYYHAHQQANIVAESGTVGTHRRRAS